MHQISIYVHNSLHFGAAHVTVLVLFQLVTCVACHTLSLSPISCLRLLSNKGKKCQKRSLKKPQVQNGKCFLEVFFGNEWSQIKTKQKATKTKEKNITKIQTIEETAVVSIK